MPPTKAPNEIAKAWGISKGSNFKAKPDEAPPDPQAKGVTATLSGAKPRWKAADGSYAIWAAVMDLGEGKAQKITLKGPLARATSGEMLSCKGRWKKHPQHGWAFEVSDYQSALPVSDAGVAAWLEARVAGVGPTFAKAIVSHFGAEKVFDLIDENPERLREVRTAKGRRLPAKQVDKAIEAWDDAKAIRQIESFLFSHGVSANLADKLYRFYGEGVVEIMQRTPYQITELRGIGFRIADRVAQSMGVKVDDPDRVEAALIYTLDEAESDGHTFLSLTQLQGRAAEALKIEGTEETVAPVKIVEGASRLAERGKLVAEADEVMEQRIYSMRMFEIERRLARTVREMLSNPPRPLFPNPKRPEPPEDASPEQIEKMQIPTDEQWSVIDLVRRDRLTILSGGPGVGKCVRGDTRVVANSDYQPIETLWEKYASNESFDGEGYWAVPSEELTVPTMTDAGQMEERPVSRLYRQRVNEKGIRVTLQDGSQVTMTKRHRLLTPEGWSNEIAVGDIVCVPGRVPRPARQKNPDRDLLTLLTWQIAEGNETRFHVDSKESGQVNIHQSDRAKLEEIRSAARRWSERSGVPLGTAGIYEYQPGVFVLRICSLAYRKWLKEHDYDWGQRSAGKRLPPFVMRANNAAIRQVLGDLFAAEGHVNKDHHRIEISSASEELLWQISLLLRRFGIWMRIRSKQSRATNGTKIWRTYFEGIVSGSSLRRFQEEIQISSVNKQAALEKIVESASNDNLDTVPVSDLLDEARANLNLGRSFYGLSSSYFTEDKAMSRATATRTATRVAEIADGSALTNYEQRRKAMKPSAGHRYHKQIHAALTSIDEKWMIDFQERLDYRINAEQIYCRVTEVEEVELDCWVYDLTIAETHNYVAGGMITHNTASVNFLIEQAELANRRVVLAAPTGKAARRMTELTAHPASTIHKLLEFSPFEGGFQRDESNPIEADLLVVDETSMLPLELADSLFRAVGAETHVLLVGDPDQLPPIGAGKVLDDLINCDQVPRVHLTKIFRQAAKSMIIQNSRRINRGEIPYLRQDEAERVLNMKMLDDFYWVTRTEPEETLKLALDMATNRIPRVFGFDPRTEVMVLAPMRKGTVGLEKLNEELETRLNPAPGGGRKEPIVPLRGISVGSRIVQTKNFYHPDGLEQSVMNGEVAIVTDYNEAEKEAELSLDDGERKIWVPISDMDTYFLAWAMSIHKTQGSSFPCVLAALSTSHFTMLTRSLLYTAVTRAEKLCVVVGEKKALHIAVDKVDTRKRNSTLAARITDPALSGELF